MTYRDRQILRLLVAAEADQPGNFLWKFRERIRPPISYVVLCLRLWRLRDAGLVTFPGINVAYLYITDAGRRALLENPE